MLNHGSAGARFFTVSDNMLCCQSSMCQLALVFLDGALWQGLNLVSLGPLRRNPVSCEGTLEDLPWRFFFPR